MTRLLTFAAILGAGASFGFAGSWTGRLVDYSCVERHAYPARRSSDQAPPACSPGRFTTKFAVQTSDGRAHPLDPTGNARAAEMMQTVTPQPDGTLVKISGDQDEDVIRVDNIEFQR